MFYFFKKLLFDKKVLLSTFLLLILCSFAFCGCSIKNKTETTIKNKDYVYDWLVENGELVNNTELIYIDDTFSLRTDFSKMIFLDYKIQDYKGYRITVTLPLYSDSKNVETKILVNNDNSSSSLSFYHYPETFSNKSPIEYGSIINSPQTEQLLIDNFGEFIEENGKLVFHLDESKREEYEKIKSKNNDIESQRTIREEIAKELSHKSLCNILDWLNKKICPSLEMNISDFGYYAYT